MSSDILQIIVLVLGGLCLGLGITVIFLLKRQKEDSNDEIDNPSEASSVMVTIGGDAQLNALFATLAHELRTPLNGLLGVAQMLNEEFDNEDTQTIEGCAKHMLAVITTLGNLSKIQAEWSDLPEYREWVNLFELTEQIKKDLNFRVGLRGLQLKMKHQDRSLCARVDRDHLKTIIENGILGSLECVALDSIPDQAETLTVSWSADQSDLKIEIENPLEVFEKNRREKIKEVLREMTGQHHARFKMEYLYWTVSTTLLEKYQGALFSKTLPDGGVHTLMSCELELMEASPSENLPIGGIHFDNGEQRKALVDLPLQLSILVAEDDPIARKLIGTILSHMGQQATFATNGREVLDLVSQNQDFDVILMDIDMPVMDGVSAAIALRNGESGESGTEIAIVAVTAFAMLSDEGKFKKAGMNYFLPKPIRLNSLREVLLEVIRKERAMV
ncbi:MAG: response regulator [Verrucomicrobiota bacterium]